MSTARILVSRVQRHARDPVTMKSPETYDVLLEIRDVVRQLRNSEEWSFFVRHVDPIVKTDTGKRTYDLPDDFPSNFIRGAEDDGSRYLCILSDGSSETFLDYKTPESFYSADFESATNQKPESYTITYDSDGKPQLSLDPPPNSNSSSHYTIRGAYRPTYENITLDSWVPTQAEDFIVWSACNVLQPQRWNMELQASRNALYLTEARSRQSQLVPRFSNYPNVNDYNEDFMETPNRNG